MPRRISIPFVVDILFVDDPDLMERLNDHPRVSRHLLESRWPGNEAIRKRIQGELRAGDRLLPVFTAREDPERARRQKEQKARLDELARTGLPDHAQDIELLAGYVAGLPAGAPVGVVVQRVVGRFFRPGYEATAESYEAARTIDEWAKADPLQALRLKAGGRLKKAKKIIWRLAGDDTECIHGTAIAMHNIVAALENMRRQLKNKGARARPPQADLGRLVHAPESLLRCCTGEFRVKGVGKPLRKGTLVLFQLGKMHAASGGLDDAFARGAWNECPAAGIVIKLLELVWEKAGKTAKVQAAGSAGTMEQGG